MPLPSQQRADDALMATDGVSGDHVLVGFGFFFKLSCGVSCTGKWIFIIMLIMYYIAWLKLKLRQARGCYLAEATPKLLLLTALNARWRTMSQQCAFSDQLK